MIEDNDIRDGIYQEGQQAFRDGKPISANPYKHSDDDDFVERTIWNNGWNAAKTEKEQPQ